MLYVGLGVSRKRLDWQALTAGGERVGEGACPPDRDGLAHLVHRSIASTVSRCSAAIESMTGARFVHDQLELAGWDVRIADAQRAKGIAPLACKTDRIDASVLAELARRDLIPEIWLPTSEVRASGSEPASGCPRTHASTLAQELRARVLFTARPSARPVTDLFGVGGRRFLERLRVARAVAAPDDRGESSS